MSQNFVCMNYGSCAAAGQPISSNAGASPTCSGCGLPMSAQGRTRSKRGLANPVKWLALGSGALIAVAIIWQVAMWGFHITVGYDIKGRWRAEETSILGLSLPVGVTLEFGEATAKVLDKQIQVLEYARDGNRVHVVVQGDADTHINLAFVFADQNHMAFEGPLGFSMRYRRVKGDK